MSKPLKVLESVRKVSSGASGNIYYVNTAPFYGSTRCKVPIVCAHKTWSINTYCNFLMAAILIRTLVCVPAAVWPEAAWPWVVLFGGLGVLTTLLGWNIGYFVPVFDGQHCADSCATQVSNQEWFSLYLASHSYGSNNFLTKIWS